MRPRDQQRARLISRRLNRFERVRPLLGIGDAVAREVFIEQLFESIHRVQYVDVILQRQISALSQNPASESFDPIKAAILAQRRGDMDEAFWLVFLSVHFGKHVRAGWGFVRDIYGAMGEDPYWTWARISADPAAFRDWLDNHQGQFHHEGVQRHFGNHRKYVSIDARSDTGTGAAFQSYCEWVLDHDNHEQLIQDAVAEFGANPAAVFDGLYRQMEVVSFGRMGKFDYLTMIGKLRLAPISPGSLYMQGATGPVRGARLLFGGDVNAAIQMANLDEWAVQLGELLGVGAQEMEDAICNWQKSPNRLIRYRG